MLKIKFVINDTLLALYMIRNTRNNRFQNDKANEDVEAFQNKAWHMSQSSNDFFRFGISDADALSGRLLETAEQANKFLIDVMQTEEFKKVKQQTDESLARITVGWDEDLPISEKYITDIMA